MELYQKKWLFRTFHWKMFYVIPKQNSCSREKVLAAKKTSL